jgi:hypothetical protein
MTKTMFRRELSKLMVFVRKYNETRRATLSLVGGDILSKEHSGLLYDMICFCIKQFAKSADDTHNLTHEYIFGRLRYDNYMIGYRYFGPCPSPQNLWALIQYINSEEFKHLPTK